MNYIDEHLQIRSGEDRVYIDGRAIDLTRKEFDLLATLAANEGEIVGRKFLLTDIWGYGEEVRTRTLDVHIRRLRRKLGMFGEVYIETVFGVGYRFKRYRPAPVYRSFFATAAIPA
jgi:DNA-binding response OmpR family regulator